MLVRFKVKNFKNFSDELILDFEKVKNYEFSAETVRNSAVDKCLVYGANGCGKSNLGLAIFDIVLHLTDKEKTLIKYIPYRNLNNQEKIVSFSYTFKFEDHYLEYCYQKDSPENLVKEEVKIDDRLVLVYDYVCRESMVSLEGTEKLNLVSMNEKLSFVKYVSRNSVLADTVENHIFQKFIDFVDHMLLFYSLSERYYQGFKVGRESITKGIIEKGKVKDFEKFLQENGIDMTLSEREIDDEKQLIVQYQSGETNFFRVASTGTKTLALFYYWYMQMEDASFVYMDEFDAFYHYELSEYVIRKIKGLKHVQFVVTTHNTDLLTNDLMRPDCLLEFRDNKIRSLADSTSKELRKAHNLQKMYKAGAFHG